MDAVKIQVLEMSENKKAIDVLFIDPPWIIESDRNFWKQIGSCLPSLGMAYVAGYLEGKGFSCRIIDSTAEKYSIADLEAILRKAEFRPKYLGLTATTPLIENALRIAEIAKRIFPNVKVVMGGVHPTVMPEEVLSSKNVDMVVRGEGEETMAEIVSGADPGKIAGISYRDGAQKTRHNPDRPLIGDLDKIPPPAYHLLPMKKYYPAIGSYKRLPAMSIFATRGCPGRCTFCYRTFFGKTRKRSARNIMEEVELLRNRYGVREIAFYDDAFTVFRKTVMEFCDLLNEKKLDVSWSCFTRADLIDEELLKRMKSAGCHLVLFGVESADEEILESINKKIDLEKVKKAVKEARKAGIETRASFMLGNPGETEETIKKTINFAFRLDPDQVHFNITTAYPGTELYEWAKTKGYLSACRWSCYTMSESNINLPTVSRERLLFYYGKVHRDFYFRPRIVLRRLMKARTLDALIGEIKGAAGLMKVFIGQNKA
ncbi:MAG: radical SAM protein [Endomicrobiales bacterium]|nr:radical SAM protein [Endomicrobiales bacterium]